MNDSIPYPLFVIYTFVSDNSSSRNEENEKILISKIEVRVEHEPSQNLTLTSIEENKKIPIGCIRYFTET